MDALLILESLIDETVRRMGFDPRVTVREMGETLFAEIEVRDGSGTLIGRRGEGIDALEDITRRMFARRVPQPPRILLDINGYRREQAMALREHAREVADRVRRHGSTYAFKPMSARERRIIHMELAARADVITESIGEGPSRHVVVRAAT